MNLEETIGKDLDSLLNIWKESIFELGYQTAKKDIIHCKDCKNNKTNSCAMSRWMYSYNEPIVKESWNTLYDFCSRAERKTE